MPINPPHKLQHGRKHRVACMLALLVIAFPACGEPIQHALLIGINEYESDKIISLRGTHNDVALIKQALVGELGFREENITVLLDSDATRRNILRALDAAVHATGKNDLLYFHYSGHGSRVPDANGDEADGFDETIIPHDGRTEEVPDILDDEIDERLASLTGNGLVVFDSCHSGTMTRSFSKTISRSIPPDTRTYLYERAQSRGVVEVPELRHVLMTSAADFEEALDGPIEGEYFGFFSYALASAMTSIPEKMISAEALYQSARVKLAEIEARLPYIDAPEPQLEGPAPMLSRILFTVPATETEHTNPRFVDVLRALANPKTSLHIEMTLAGRYGCVSPARIRGIRDRSTTTTVRGSNTRHIRKPGDQRTFENSMQVRIFSESESFITLLYLDGNDIITLLFPETNIPYLPGGRTTAGAVVCLPDSLGANNEAGFYWDLGPPAGTDTLLLIATSDLDSASRIRRLIHSASPEEEKITMLEGILAQANDWNVINLPIRVLDQ